MFGLRSVAIGLATLLLLTAAGCGGDGTNTVDSDSEDLAPELASAVEAGDSDPGPLAGTWAGTLEQEGQPSFPVHATIRSLTDRAENTVNYGGSINCLGNWKFRPNAGSGETVEFTEVIDSGRGGNCKGRGTVSLTATSDPHALDYVFKGGGIESSGTLTRERP